MKTYAVGSYYKHLTGPLLMRIKNMNPIRNNENIHTFLLKKKGVSRVTSVQFSQTAKFLKDFKYRKSQSHEVPA